MSKNVLITGANRGIGLALCRAYQAQGADVIAVCRSFSEELQELGVEIIDQVDVSKAEAVESLKAQIKGRSIDILINNAGILSRQTLDEIDYAKIQKQFEVNTLGPLRVTEALLPSMSSGSKIALITSRMGSIADNSSGSSYGYRMSKAALNAAGKSLAIDLKTQGIAVAILHPGYVQTEMVGFGGEISPQVAAERLAQRIEELNLDNTGSFWHANGDALPW